MLSSRRSRFVGLAIGLTAVSWCLPAMVSSAPYNENHCGEDRDIRSRAIGLLARLGPGRAAADGFKVEQQGAQCMLDDKTAVKNQSSRMAEHTFEASHTSKTNYTIKVSGGFKEAFSAEMGYSAENSATESYKTTIEIPPNTGARLSVVTSVWTVSGTWTHGPFYRRHKDYIEVRRPTGELVWLIRDYDG
jgi:hypothetical protein